MVVEYTIYLALLTFARRFVTSGCIIHSIKRSIAH
jgi:hypothetical protein